MHSSWAMAVAMPLFGAACSNEPIVLRGAGAVRDAASTVDRDAAGRPVHDATIRPVIEAASSDASCKEATMASIPPDATAGPGCSGGVSAPPGGMGDPPPHCFAPCVWELVKRCLPRGQCVTQSYKAIAGMDAEVSCAPDNEWWSILSAQIPIKHGGTKSYYLGDCPCYSEGRVYVGGLSERAEWRDADGRAVAVSMYSPGSPMTVICGPVDSLSGSPFRPDGTLMPGFTAFDGIDPDLPDCRPWNPVCEPGCCPGNPPELPYTGY